MHELQSASTMDDKPFCAEHASESVARTANAVHCQSVRPTLWGGGSLSSRARTVCCWSCKNPMARCRTAYKCQLKLCCWSGVGAGQGPAPSAAAGGAVPAATGCSRHRGEAQACCNLCHPLPVAGSHDTCLQQPGRCTSKIVPLQSIRGDGGDRSCSLLPSASHQKPGQVALASGCRGSIY